MHEPPAIPRIPSGFISVLTRFAFVVQLLSFALGTKGQLVNGQFFTSGLVISNAPAPASQHTVGGSIAVSVDVSGNGRLSQAASLPGSTLPTAILSLNIFLVSSQANVNITVSAGSQLLEGEQGSTVKHLDWQIPGCLPGGNYNLTYYEYDRINQLVYYSITPIPITIIHPASFPTPASALCKGSVTPSPQPQVSSPPPSNLFLNPGAIVSSGVGVPTASPVSGSTTLQTQAQVITSVITLYSTLATTLTTVDKAVATETPPGSGQVVMDTGDDEKGDEINSGNSPVLTSVNGLKKTPASNSDLGYSLFWAALIVLYYV